MLVIDGSQGEGGGQILRTSLSLAALTGRPFEMTRVRAGRSQPGLRPQHLLAVRALAAICAARLKGDELGSQFLRFEPTRPPQAGAYRFDVMEVARGGSAGSVTLIWQALLWPLLFAGGPSRLVLRGGTHVPFSPPFHYLTEVAGPVFGRFGAIFSRELKAGRWYPIGQGEMPLDIQPTASLRAVTLTPPAVDNVQGLAVAVNLPSHIPQRMKGRADNLLAELGLKSAIQPLRLSGPSTGAGLFLWLSQAGFTSLGRPGLPSDQVAESAVAELRAFMDAQTAVDAHLADQLLLPAVLAHGTTTFTTAAITEHTLTQARLLQQWLQAVITVTGQRGQPGAVRVTGLDFTLDRTG